MNKLTLKKAEKWDMGDGIGTRQYCVVCGKMATKPTGVAILYQRGNKELTYNMVMCIKCYSSSIEGKPLNELKSFIPLLKMKANRSITTFLNNKISEVYSLQCKYE